MGAQGQRRVLLVVGMHRSGTSALCAALQAAGASFGDQLLEAMAGVNDEGFWEDAEVVALNDSLLASRDACWYRPYGAVGVALSETETETDEGGYPREAYAAEYDQAAQIFARGFGQGPVEAVKDPRFCLTLPFWFNAAREAGLCLSVCVAGRSPLDVARSLHKRDGFPVAYGLRLWQVYMASLSAALRQQPPAGGQFYVTYPALLEDSRSALSELVESLPGLQDSEALAGAVRGDLRHQHSREHSELARVPESLAHSEQLGAMIEGSTPLLALSEELVETLVQRARELSAIGESHSEALATISLKDRDNAALAAELELALATVRERDSQIREIDERLQRNGAELGEALATISERDLQIRDLDERLQDIGRQHAHALEVIAEKDRQLAEFRERLEYLYKLPVVGQALRLARKYAKR